MCDSLKTLLSAEGYEINTAGSGEEAIEMLNKKSFDLVITDLVMAEADGIHVLKTAKALHPEIQVIILTGYGDMASAIDALRFDADDYLLKPCEPEDMFFRVSRCFEKLELQRKIKIYENILPVCCVCKKIRDDAGKKPGTGKWVSVEEYIHDKAKLDITSSYCPECGKKAMEELDRL